MLAVLTNNAISGEIEQNNKSCQQLQMKYNSTMAQTTKIGDVSITCIKDNKEERMMPLDLFGNIPQNIVDSLNIQNGVKSSVNTFLVSTNGVDILFDTGLGSQDSQLLKALDNKPESIKLIYLTHFHGDHIGGMLKDGKPVFPNAEIYASREEYEAWMNMPDKAKEQAAKTMKAYEKQLHLFEFGDTLPGNVTAIDGRGHTPGHTIFKINDKILIVGDILHGMALQTTFPEFCAKFDMDKENAIKSRKYVLEYGKSNDAIIVGMHVPMPGIVPTK